MALIIPPNPQQKIVNESGNMQQHFYTWTQLISNVQTEINTGTGGTLNGGRRLSGSGANIGVRRI